MKTSGHLANNGGIRGHSAGVFFPFIVVAKGTINNIRWHVQSPNGRLSQGFKEINVAHRLASLKYLKWSSI